MDIAPYRIDRRANVEHIQIDKEIIYLVTSKAARTSVAVVMEYCYLTSIVELAASCSRTSRDFPKTGRHVRLCRFFFVCLHISIV